MATGRLILYTSLHMTEFKPYLRAHVEAQRAHVLWLTHDEWDAISTDDFQECTMQRDGCAISVGYNRTSYYIWLIPDRRQPIQVSIDFANTKMLWNIKWTLGA